MKKIALIIASIAVVPHFAAAQVTAPIDGSIIAPPVTIQASGIVGYGCTDPDFVYRLSLNSADNCADALYSGPIVASGTVNYSGVISGVAPGTYFVCGDCSYDGGATWDIGSSAPAWSSFSVIAGAAAILPANTAADIAAQTSGLMFGIKDIVILVIALLMFFLEVGWIISIFNDSDLEDEKLKKRTKRAISETKRLLDEK